MAEPTQLHRIPLPDGRILAVAEYGEPGGAPLLFLHGTPGSHRLAGIIADEAQRHGFRLLAPDRPGLGYSTHDPKRTFLSFADDIRVALDHFGFARTHLVGISGGGPYTLACARAFPERLDRVILLSPWWFPHGAMDARKGLNPVFKTYEWAVRKAHWLTKLMARGVTSLARRNPRALIKHLIHQAPPDDKRLLADPAVQSLLADDIAMAFRQGWQGQWRESWLDFSAHGFDVADIQTSIAIHHGARDNVVPLHYAEKLKARLKAASLSIEPEGGHFVAIRLQDRIFRELKATPPSVL